MTYHLTAGQPTPRPKQWLYAREENQGATKVDPMKRNHLLVIV